MKVSKNSWHYNLYRMGNAGPFRYRDNWYVNKPKDLCQYIRNIFVGFGSTFILIIGGFILSLFILDLPISIVLYFITDNGWIDFLSEPTRIIGSIIYGFLSLGIILYYGVELYGKFNEKIPDNVKVKIKDYKNKVKDSVEESETINLVKEGYKSFKDKTCVFIEVKD